MQILSLPMHKDFNRESDADKVAMEYGFRYSINGNKFAFAKRLWKMNFEENLSLHEETMIHPPLLQMANQTMTILLLIGRVPRASLRNLANSMIGR